MAQTEKEVLKSKLLKILSSAIECDSWGQVVEATEAYEKISSLIDIQESSSKYSGEETLKSCIVARIKALNSLGDGKNISLEEISALKPGTKSSKSDASKFPISVPVPLSFISNSPTKTSLIPTSGDSSEIQNQVKESEVKDKNIVETGGTLLGPPKLTKGHKYIIIKIEKIGLKEAVQYIDPFLSVFVCDEHGNAIGPVQDTPVSNKKQENFIEFNCKVNIQSSVNEFTQRSAIFFEFKHYKPKKRKVSTKAWCFMELDELKNGNVVLEIYQKPTDRKRKKIRLLSIKHLFLHLDIQMYIAD